MLLDMVVRLLEQVREENSALRARLQGALRALYGRRSEKVVVEQLSLLQAGYEEHSASAGMDNNPTRTPSSSGSLWLGRRLAMAKTASESGARGQITG